MNIIYQIFGTVLGFMYELVNSYGLAIILFTVFVKLLLFPLGIKQQKTTVAQMRIKPQEEHIRKKYANNKEKLNEEIMALYQKEKINPMGGCLPMLIQLPILFALYGVINRPLSFILKLPEETITALQTALSAELETSGANMAAGTRYLEIPIARLIETNMDKVAHLLPEGFTPIDFSFLGLDLSQTPQLRVFSWLWLIPVLSTALTYLTSVVSQKLSSTSVKTEGSGPDQTAGMMKMMNLMMPLMTLWISFSVPAGVGLYWMMSSVLSILQTFVLSRMYNPKKAYEEAKNAFESSTVKRKKRRRLEFEQQKALGDGDQAAQGKASKETSAQDGPAGDEEPAPGE